MATLTTAEKKAFDRPQLKQVTRLATSYLAKPDDYEGDDYRAMMLRKLAKLDAGQLRARVNVAQARVGVSAFH